MRFLIAPDSFKECMTAKEACEAIEEGINSACEKLHEFFSIPLSDGGEGMLPALIGSAGGSYRTFTVNDPLMRLVEAKLGMLNDNVTAVVEMAEASGLQLLAQSERNPHYTTSFGTGELICRAIEMGAKKIIVGIGGSAVNDGGMGMLAAMGAEFYGADGCAVGHGGINAGKICGANFTALNKFLEPIEITAACDVTNPLLGTNGATYVFSEQKGSDAKMRETLESCLTHYSKVIHQITGTDISCIPGAGAAGGVGAALLGICRAKMRKGIDLVFEYTGIENKIAGCDIVITGEGGVDYQTAFGKTPFGVAQLAKKYGKPVICLAGYLGEGYESLYEHGFTSFFSISNGIMQR
ncbi:MAG: glycerate kinase, partial [Defluviitaleaceae bacterium]|nr:glycerate kinase [Defluviitaleaceae bacterium]